MRVQEVPPFDRGGGSVVEREIISACLTRLRVSGGAGLVNSHGQHQEHRSAAWTVTTDAQTQTQIGQRRCVYANAHGHGTPRRGGESWR